MGGKTDAGGVVRARAEVDLVCEMSELVELGCLLVRAGYVVQQSRAWRAMLSVSGGLRLPSTAARVGGLGAGRRRALVGGGRCACGAR